MSLVSVVLTTKIQVKKSDENRKKEFIEIIFSALGWFCPLFNLRFVCTKTLFPEFLCTHTVRALLLLSIINSSAYICGIISYRKRRLSATGKHSLSLDDDCCSFYVGKISKTNVSSLNWHWNKKQNKMIQNISIGSEWLRTHKTMMVLVVDGKKIFVAISNSFYIVLCSMLVHIPNTHQISSKSDEKYRSQRDSLLVDYVWLVY